MSILEKIGKSMRNLIFSEYESCYADMENQGIAVTGCYSGLVGGTSSTEYLSEKCCSCKYFTKTEMRNEF